MKFRFTCVCGSSYELSAWGVREIEGTERWHDLHAHCAVAWQREHGVQTRLKRTSEEDADE